MTASMVKSKFFQKTNKKLYPGKAHCFKKKEIIEKEIKLIIDGTEQAIKSFNLLAQKTKEKKRKTRKSNWVILFNMLTC